MLCGSEKIQHPQDSFLPVVCSLLLPRAIQDPQAEELYLVPLRPHAQQNDPVREHCPATDDAATMPSLQDQNCGYLFDIDAHVASKNVGPKPEYHQNDHAMVE